MTGNSDTKINKYKFFILEPSPKQNKPSGYPNGLYLFSYEHLCPISGAACCVSNAKLGEGRVQNVLPVPLGIHP